MHFIESNHRLQFDNDDLFDDEINSLAGNLDPTILNPHRSFAFVCQPARFQFYARRLPVN